MKTKSPQQIVYVDEAGIDNRDDYPYGYSKVGQRFHALKSGKRVERVSWIAALKLGKLFAPMTYAGSCNRDLFELWLEQCLVPQLQPGDVIVIDNASFHHSQTIEEIVAEAGCELWYLPPYSPDLNKIERWWFVLKNWMRQHWDDFACDARLRRCCLQTMSKRFSVGLYNLSESQGYVAATSTNRSCARGNHPCRLRSFS